MSPPKVILVVAVSFPSEECDQIGVVLPVGRRKIGRSNCCRYAFPSSSINQSYKTSKDFWTGGKGSVGAATSSGPF